MLAASPSSGMCGEADSCKFGVGCKAGEFVTSKHKHCGSREDSVLRACCECPACCTASDEACDALAELREAWLCFRQDSAGQVCCVGTVSSTVVEGSTMLQHWLVSACSHAVSSTDVEVLTMLQHWLVPACSQTDATVAFEVLHVEV